MGQTACASRSNVEGSLQAEMLKRPPARCPASAAMAPTQRTCDEARCNAEGDAAQLGDQCADREQPLDVHACAGEE